MLLLTLDEGLAQVPSQLLLPLLVNNTFSFFINYQLLIRLFLVLLYVILNFFSFVRGTQVLPLNEDKRIIDGSNELIADFLVQMVLFLDS